MFCFPYSGGTASHFRGWPNYFDEHVEVVGVEPPGRAWRRSEPAYTDAVKAAEAFCDAVASELQAPFVLYGHSVGALFAYEVAHTLRARNLPAPAGLFVSGRKPPHRTTNNIEFSALPDSQFLAAVAALGGVPEIVLRDRDLQQMVIGVMRADLTMAERRSYIERGPLETPLFVYTADTDPLVNLDEAPEWQQHSVASCVVRKYRGGHFFIQDTKSSFFADLAKDVTSVIGRPLA